MRLCGPTIIRGVGPVLWRRMIWLEKVMTCQCEPLAKAGWALRGPAAHVALSFAPLEGVLAGVSRGRG